MDPAKPSVGDTVVFYYWTQGELRSASAKVTAVHDPDPDHTQALALDVDLPIEVMNLEGYIREQSHSRQRTITEDTIHASGTWALVS